MTAGSATLLVFGRHGQVGSELLRAPPPPGWTVRGLGRDEADLTRPDTVAAAVAVARPTVVVNAAAYTAVDRAESEAELAFAVNRDGPAALARACARQGVPLIHLSTDYVFNGRKPAPYVEDDPIDPLNVYGASKAAGEQAVREAGADHIILRTSWVFSPFGLNFVKTMLRLGRERPQLGIVGDQTGCPTAAADIAGTVLALAAALGQGRRDGLGTFHFCNAGATTWFGFAEAIFERVAAAGGTVPALKAIATDQYPTPAVRPRNSVLDGTRIGSVHGIHPRPWRAGLAECLDILDILRADPA